MEEKRRTLAFDRASTDVFERVMKTLTIKRINFSAEYDSYGVDLISFCCDDNFYERLINNADVKGTNYCRYE